MNQRPIFDVFASLRGRVPWVELGDLPTPVMSLAPTFAAAGRPEAEGWVKRDDTTSPIYGGNKVRTLEVLFGRARELGCTHVYSTGAFGSNHAAATVLHARSVGLEPGIVLFPQPASTTARANLEVILSERPTARALPHWSALPLGMAAARRMHDGRGEKAFVMVPGGATALGALGYVSAAFELAQQVRAGELPAPRVVFVGVGSTCTSAGLLLGFHHAARLGLGFAAAPRLVAVRVTPWPVTSPVRIARLAAATSRLLAERTGDASLAVSYRTLRAGLEVDRRFLGRGYGHATDSGREAIRRFALVAGLDLDTTYSAKAGAAVLHAVRERRSGPFVYWATKSTAPLPAVDRRALADAPRSMRRWLRQAPKS